MCFDDFWKRFAAFGLTFAFGLTAAAILYTTKSEKIKRPEINSAAKIVYSTQGGNGASGPDYGPDDPRNFRDNKSKDSKTEPSKGVRIVSKPRAVYTDAARDNRVQGKVVLRVTFTASGQIGAITVISGLPDGLTEQAIAAARGIKFEPAARGGVAFSVTKPVEYTFTIY